MYASLRGHLELVKLLLSKGADVNARNMVGSPRLFPLILVTHMLHCY